MVWDLTSAALVCRLVEEVAPEYGAHVALTGGTLYKDGSRKDVDLLFYRVRQAREIRIDELLERLKGVGFFIGERFGWVQKASFEGKPVDLFFPEAYPETLPDRPSPSTLAPPISPEAEAPKVDAPDWLGDWQ